MFVGLLLVPDSQVAHAAPSRPKKGLEDYGLQGLKRNSDMHSDERDRWGGGLLGGSGNGNKKTLFDSGCQSGIHDCRGVGVVGPRPGRNEWAIGRERLWSCATFKKKIKNQCELWSVHS